MVIVRTALTAGQGPAPSGSSLVKVNVTIPENPEVGVKVTAEGLLVKEVLHKTPLPDVILHIPLVVAPDTLAPVSVIADGVDD